MEEWCHLVLCQTKKSNNEIISNKKNKGQKKINYSKKNIPFVFRLICVPHAK
jgi:hypothetical protein